MPRSPQALSVSRQQHALGISFCCQWLVVGRPAPLCMCVGLLQNKLACTQALRCRSQVHMLLLLLVLLSASAGPLSRPMKRARTSNRGTASVKPVQGAASVPAAAWLAVSTKVAPPAIRMGRSPAAFAWGAPGVNSSVHAFDQSLPFCAVPGSSQPSTRKGVFR